MLSSNLLGQILVVADGAQPIAKSLARAGYQAIIAHDGHEAMIVTSQIKCDVALVDLNSSEISGMELVRKLKECVPDLEVITLTGLSADFASEGLGTDLDDSIFQCVSKPIDMSLLTRTVQRAVERRELLRENRRLHHAVDACPIVNGPQASTWAASQRGRSEPLARQRNVTRVSDRLRETEVKTIVAALVRTQWNQRHTAELLHISYSALRRRIAKYRLAPSRNINEWLEHA